MKYIIVIDHDLPMAIWFDPILNHSDIAFGKEVVSAGHCNSSGQAYGYSVTLLMKSRPEDTDIIRQSMNRT